jgi:hypothetical protein
MALLRENKGFPLVGSKCTVSELGDGRLKVSGGVFQRANAVNRNGRVYPRVLLERELSEDSEFMRSVANRANVGNIEHPDESAADLRKAAILVTENRILEDNTVVGSLETLNTANGLIAKALFEAKVTVGISSRGQGSVQRAHDGTDVVQDDFTLITYDLVADPSTHGASFIQESAAKKAAPLHESTENVVLGHRIQTMLERIEEHSRGFKFHYNLDVSGDCLFVQAITEELVGHGANVARISESNATKSAHIRICAESIIKAAALLERCATALYNDSRLSSEQSSAITGIVNYVKSGAGEDCGCVRVSLNLDADRSSFALMEGELLAVQVLLDEGAAIADKTSGQFAATIRKAGAARASYEKAWANALVESSIWRNERKVAAINEPTAPTTIAEPKPHSSVMVRITCHGTRQAEKVRTTAMATSGAMHELAHRAVDSNVVSLRYSGATTPESAKANALDILKSSGVKARSVRVSAVVAESAVHPAAGSVVCVSVKNSATRHAIMEYARRAFGMKLIAVVGERYNRHDSVLLQFVDGVDTDSVSKRLAHFAYELHEDASTFIAAASLNETSRASAPANTTSSGFGKKRKRKRKVIAPYRSAESVLNAKKDGSNPRYYYRDELITAERELDAGEAGVFISRQNESGKTVIIDVMNEAVVDAEWLRNHLRKHGSPIGERRLRSFLSGY